MDRALDIEALAEALGQQSVVDASPSGTTSSPLPSAAELQRLLGQAEADLFLNRHSVPDDLVRTAWYLHGVANASAAHAAYGPERRRRAFQVSAHILDLASTNPETMSVSEALSRLFAAQIGYQRGELQPNAQALARRANGLVNPQLPFLERLPTLALEAGTTFLGLDTRILRSAIRGWRSELAALAHTIEATDLLETGFGAAAGVVEGIARLLRYLTNGGEADLEAARAYFERAITTDPARPDRDARWVASQLRFLADEMELGSLWRLMPPNAPPGARHAFTVTSPSVLTLWQPQRELLTPSDPASGASERHGLDPALRRLVISVPTSGGKTLFGELLMVTHLASQESAVCYVTPLRSLGREVRRNLRRRLRVLAREVGPEEPDFGVPPGGPLVELFARLGLDVPTSDVEPDEPDVAVMTPERLAHALRDDTEHVLSRFGLFIFDEAHLVADRSRGFLLESLLAFLHWKTRNSHHRLILLSAALGNAGHVREWLDVDGGSRLVQSSWRGPRRLHAIFNTEIRWDRGIKYSEAVNARGKSAHLVQRQFYDTWGLVRLRPAEDQPLQARTTHPLGVTAFRATALGERERSPESDYSTAFYKMLASIVQYVAHGGPVMVIRNTRRDAVNMAKVLAADLEAYQPARPIAQLALIRLGPDHPLVEVLTKGVAYHHAGLPVDVLEAIEDGLRTDALRFIVATSTLTEGVNLPVRTVVLAANSYEGQPLDQQLTGARLINAIGRAGRATRETEGWVVLARQARPLDTDFALLDENRVELAVSSRLADAEALEVLAAYEAAVAAGADALLATEVVADFVGFIWFVLAAEEELGRVGESADPVGAFRATLAYTELSPIDRARFEKVISEVSTVYLQTDASARRRWARTGTTVGTARRLDAFAAEMAESIAAISELDRLQLGIPATALGFLGAQGLFEVLLDLPERPREWVFHETVSTRSALVAVDVVAFMQVWISGAPIQDIAEALFLAIPDSALRLERTVDAVTDFCEHYFSWTIGIVVSMINARLQDRLIEERLSPDLALYARYGVSSVEAVELVLAGVRSREVAVRIADEAGAANESNLRQWLSGMSINDWRERFDATPADVLDLVEYSRRRGLGLLRTLLRDGVVTLDVNPLQPNGTDDQALPVRVEYVDGSGDPPELGVFSDQLIATIPIAAHAEIEAVLGTGFTLTAILERSTLRLSVDEDELAVATS